jgi:hypothetical protein
VEGRALGIQEKQALKRSMFFSEEKNQKTFGSGPFAGIRQWPADIG